MRVSSRPYLAGAPSWLTRDRAPAAARRARDGRTTTSPIRTARARKAGPGRQAANREAAPAPDRGVTRAGDPGAEGGRDETTGNPRAGAASEFPARSRRADPRPLP